MNTEEKTWGTELNPGGLSHDKKHNRRRRILIIIGVLLIVIISEFFRSNLYISVEEIDYLNKDIPKAFNNVKIVQISDYHNHGGSYDDRLIDKIKQESPDYIFITGDIADSIKTDIDKANSFLQRISAVAECYLVWGNHDHRLAAEDLNKMRSCCKKYGITVLENEFTTLTREGQSILLVGSDAAPDTGKGPELMRTLPSGEKFVMWLHHFPEDFEKIVTESEKRGSKVDLLFCGHAHGGLIGVPFVGGLYAPGQGMFPKYTSGRYNIDDSIMLVSRGVGNSGWSLRWANSFHLVVCTLKSGQT